MPPFDPQKHHRRSIRLRGYDYTQVGAYFVTMVTQGRACLFGDVVNGEMVLNDLGKIVQKWWDDLPIHFSNVETGVFVVMPNHVHGVIIIVHDGRGAVSAPGLMHDSATNYDGSSQTGREDPAPTGKPTLGQVVAYFKYQSTKEINGLDGSRVLTNIWQRNYYERIIRNVREMEAIWGYIEGNPANWEQDKENLQGVGL
jgi:REP element-mobilizing transposase RayT